MLSLNCNVGRLRQISTAIVAHVKTEDLVLRVEQTTTSASVATDTSAVTARQVCLHQIQIHLQIHIVPVHCRYTECIRRHMAV